MPRFAKTKLMGRVALTTARLAMKSRLTLGRSVTGRARSNLCEGFPGWVRIVTARTCPGSPMFRMVRMDVSMTLCATRRRRSPDVVRIVAVFAIPMGSRQLPAEHVHFLMTGAAVDRPRRAPLMRPVTGNTLRVPFGEKSGLGNFWLRISVTDGTSLPGFRRGRMLAGVARGASFHRIFALGRVKARHLRVTGGARSSLRFALRVGRVTGQAVTGSMHVDG